jgi:hypothetical protein
MNALMFVSTREVIRRPEIDHVSYGLRAIFADIPTLNRFKESMGYKRVDVVERIETNPKIRSLCESTFLCSLTQGALGKYARKSDKAKRICAIMDMISKQGKLQSASLRPRKYGEK